MELSLLKRIDAFARHHGLFRVDKKRNTIDRTAAIKLLCVVALDGNGKARKHHQ